MSKTNDEQANEQTVPLSRKDDLVTYLTGDGSLSEEHPRDGSVNVGQRWQVLERIGSGGMSTVFKAKHLVMKKVVAVKVLLPHLAQNSMTVRRFQQEAEAACRLKHANVISVYDCGNTEDGEVFMIMEYLEGGSVAEALEKEGLFEPERALSIFTQAAHGLAHAHENGIIHRDLKPSNLFLMKEDGKEMLKIVDFGIAKILSEDSQHLTKTGEIFGSPLYMSPEQWQCDVIDFRSDIYSLGCVMYEVMTGFPPFHGSNPVETMYRHLNEDPQPFAQVGTRNRRLKRRLEEICLKCLAKNPDKRYQTMTELEAELARAGTASDATWSGRKSSGDQLTDLIRSARIRARQIRSAMKRHWIATTIACLCFAGTVALFGVVPDFVSTEELKHRPLIPMVQQPTLKDPATFDDQFALTQRLALMHTGETEVLVARQDLAIARFFMSYGHWAEAAAKYKIAAPHIPDVAFRGRADVLKEEGICVYWQALSTPQRDQRNALLHESESLLNQSINGILQFKVTFLPEPTVEAFLKDRYGDMILDHCKYLVGIYEALDPMQLSDAKRYCHYTATLYDTMIEYRNTAYKNLRKSVTAVQADISRLQEAYAESAALCDYALRQYEAAPPSADKLKVYVLSCLVYAEAASTERNKYFQREATDCARQALLVWEKVEPGNHKLEAMLHKLYSDGLWSTGHPLEALMQRGLASIAYFRTLH